MEKISYYKAPHVEVVYNPTHQTVEYKWIGFVNDAKAKEGMQKITEAIIKYKAPFMIADLIEFKGGLPETAQYVNDIWSEDLKKAGLQKIALNLPESIFGEITNKKALGEKFVSLHTVEKFAASFEQAYQWFKSK
ncbi:MULTISPECIES: hypothetical protein [Xanthocytophaga]|uniref:STAS/SEC14 domain-containing protein n=2 Tax=Xanthocytophaga TaxID=3078918 RepID=A0AAE3QL04_9BACT|nr:MULTISPECIES: hypothetical protein [Xanthocytophaga]MDJ1479020.1 hypothetical protein [Xanthocytophaga flavus]MDJ1500533.1 hypothetical protein [Xanthocytophaga agilis]